MVGFPYLHCAGGTLPTLGGGFLMVTTFSLLRAGRLGVLTVWGAVIEPLAPIFIAVCCFLPEREGKIVIMSTPDPSSLSLDKNNTSAKVRVEGYLDNAYADLHQHSGLSAI